MFSMPPQFQNVRAWITLSRGYIHHWWTPAEAEARFGATLYDSGDHFDTDGRLLIPVYPGDDYQDKPYGCG